MDTNNCTILLAPRTLSYDSSSSSSTDLGELRRLLEKGNDASRIEAMKTILGMVCNGDTSCHQLLMHIIRFVLPNQKNKFLKKLVLLYFEVIPKVDKDGKLLQEMILLCNALRNDLQHPNEYVRGVTLRFVCKLEEPEIIEPLLSAIRPCLEHRHPFVRRNAVMAIWSIYRNVDYLVPDAPELLEAVLAGETDSLCQRNAFLALSQIQPARALGYFESISGRIGELDQLLQLALLEFIRSDGDAGRRDGYIGCLEEMIRLQHTAPPVKFEAASTLLLLTGHANHVKAAATCFIDLTLHESENSAKLVVLDRLAEVQRQHPSVVGELVPELMRVLGSSDLEVRRRSLAILLASLQGRQALEVVGQLKKDLGRVPSDYDQALEYRLLLLETIHQASIRYPEETAAVAMTAYLEVLGEGQQQQQQQQQSSRLLESASQYIKETLERVASLRASTVITLLLSQLEAATNPRVAESLLWVLGEYCTSDPQSILEGIEHIGNGLGPLPMVKHDEEAELQEATSATTNDQLQPQPQPQLTKASSSSSRKILPDGTYATETALTVSSTKDSNPLAANNTLGNGAFLKGFLVKGHFGVAATCASTLTKLVLNLERLAPSHASSLHRARARAMLLMTNMIKYGLSRFVSGPLDRDSYDRIILALRVLGQRDPVLELAFSRSCHEAFERLISEADRVRRLGSNNSGAGSSLPTAQQIDQPLQFRQLLARQLSPSIAVDALAKDLQKALVGGGATGISSLSAASSSASATASELSRVVQLTGFSDSVYAETYVTVNHSDVLLDILVVNQTDETLQNVHIDLTTSGDLRVTEKPASFTLGPEGFATAKAVIKVSSTDNGSIFGSISWGMINVETVVLNVVHLDVTDYIRRATISEAEFRQMWPSLEWENKININPINKGNHDLNDLVDLILKSTHLTSLGISTTTTTTSNTSNNNQPAEIEVEEGVGGDADNFLAANLYARSMFNEDVLANLCLESHDGQISGHVRLRSKVQGIAVSLGEKINNVVMEASRRFQRAN